MKPYEMNHFEQRRKMLLATAGAAGALFALSRCSTAPSTVTTAPTALQTAATDIGLIATAFQNTLTQANLVAAGISSATATQVTSLVSTLAADATAISNAVTATTTPSSSTVTEIASVITSVANAVLPSVPGGSVIELAVDAGASLLPTILAAFGITGATLSAPTLVAAKFQPAAAVAILKGLAS